MSSQPPGALRAALYDWECEHVLHRDDSDVDWLATVATDVSGPVLELACGTGRVTVPLAARLDRAVVGLDFDREMLTAARQRGARRLICGDMRAFAFGCRFGMIALPYNSLQLLDDDGIASSLDAVAAHLAPGGMFAVECVDFQAGASMADVDMEPLGAGTLPSGARVELAGALRHDFASRVSTYRRCFTVDGRRYDDAVLIRSLAADELTAFLSAHRLAVTWQERIGARTRCLATVETP